MNRALIVVGIIVTVVLCIGLKKSNGVNITPTVSHYAVLYSWIELSGVIQAKLNYTPLLILQIKKSIYPQSAFFKLKSTSTVINALYYNSLNIHFTDNQIEYLAQPIYKDSFVYSQQKSWVVLTFNNKIAQTIPWIVIVFKIDVWVNGMSNEKISRTIK